MDIRLKQRAQRKIAIELAQITQRNKWTCSVLAFTNLQKCPHGDKYCMFKYKYKYLGPTPQVQYEYKYFKTVLEYKYQVLYILWWCPYQVN